MTRPTLRLTPVPNIMLYIADQNGTGIPTTQSSLTAIYGRPTCPPLKRWYRREMYRRLCVRTTLLMENHAAVATSYCLISFGIGGDLKEWSCPIAGLLTIFIKKDTTSPMKHLWMLWQMPC